MIDLLGAGNPYMAQGFAEGGEAANAPPPIRQRPEAYIQMTPGMTQPEYAELSRQEGLRLMRGEEARTLADMLYAPKKAASDAFWNERIQKEQQRVDEANRQLAFYGRDTVSPDELRGTPEYDRVNSYVDEYLERVKRDYWSTTGRNTSQKLLSDANSLRNIPEPWATKFEAIKLSDGSTFIYDKTGEYFNTREDAERLADTYEQRANDYRQVSDNIVIQNLYNQYGISPTEKDSAQKFRDALFSTAGWQLTKAAEVPKYEYELKNATRERDQEQWKATLASTGMAKFGRQQIQNALFQSYNPQELQSEIERLQKEGVPQNWWGEDISFSNARYNFEPTFRPPTAQATTPTTPTPQAPGAVAPTTPTTPAPVLPQPGQQAPVMPGGMQPTTPGGTSPTAPGGTTPTAPAPAPIQYLSPTAQPPIGGVPQPFQFLPRTVVPYTPAQYESMFPGYTGTTQQASQPLQQQQPMQQIQYGPIGQAATAQPTLLDTLLRPPGQQDQTAVSLLGANNPYMIKSFAEGGEVTSNVEVPEGGDVYSTILEAKLAPLGQQWEEARQRLNQQYQQIKQKYESPEANQAFDQQIQNRIDQLFVNEVKNYFDDPAFKAEQRRAIDAMDKLQQVVDGTVAPGVRLTYKDPDLATQVWEINNYGRPEDRQDAQRELDRLRKIYLNPQTNKVWEFNPQDPFNSAPGFIKNQALQDVGDKTGANQTSTWIFLDPKEGRYETGVKEITDRLRDQFSLSLNDQITRQYQAELDSFEKEQEKINIGFMNQYDAQAKTLGQQVDSQLNRYWQMAQDSNVPYTTKDLLGAFGLAERTPVSDFFLGNIGAQQLQSPLTPTTPLTPTAPTAPAPGSGSAIPTPGQGAGSAPAPVTPTPIAPSQPGQQAPIQYISPTPQPPIGGIPQPYQFLPQTVTPYTPAQYQGMFPGYSGTTQQEQQPSQQSQQQQIQYSPIGQAAVGQTTLLDFLLKPQGQQDQGAVSLLGANNPYLMKPFG